MRVFKRGWDGWKVFAGVCDRHGVEVMGLEGLFEGAVGGELDGSGLEVRFDGGGAEGFHFGEAFGEEAGVGGGEVVDVSGVDHDFAGAFREMGEEVLPDGDGGFARGGEAEEPVGGAEPCGDRFSREGSGEVRLDAVGEGEGNTGEFDFAGAAKSGDIRGFADVDDGSVESGKVGGVFVGIDVRGGEAAVLGVLDLGAEFVSGLFAGVAGAEGEEKLREGAFEFAGGIEEAFAGGEWLALDEVEVDADAEGGGLAGEIDGAVAVGHVGHEGGGGEEALAMGAEDAIGNAGGEAEVVSVDDEGGHGEGSIRGIIGRRRVWKRFRRDRRDLLYSCPRRAKFVGSSLAMRGFLDARPSSTCDCAAVAARVS